jgi:hypothetical protein
MRLLFLFPIVIAGCGEAPMRKDAAYAYSSATFRGFVADSYANAGKEGPDEFFRWMDEQNGYKWVDELETESAVIDEFSDDQKAKAQMQLGAKLHKKIKKIVPRFNLDRGFEFHYTVSRGERQCYLQAVLIAALLQEAGQNAGVAMVSKNHHGQPTNNGHAVTLLALANGRHIIVDASEPEPFAKQQGLFLRDAGSGGYVYVTPVYAADHSISAFKRVGDGKPLKDVGTLDIAFVQSQFEFYRGERTPGSLVLTPVTAEGLAKSEKHLRKSVQLCPGNTLAVFTLGRVLERQGKRAEAREVFVRAAKAYQVAGWLPEGPRQALARTAKK